MDQAIVGVALQTAEKELAQLRQQQSTAASINTINIARVLELMEFTAEEDLEDANSTDAWERLSDLVRLVDVQLTTKQHPTRTFGGKPVTVLDRAIQHKGTDLEQSLKVHQLPALHGRGGAIEWADLRAALTAI